MKFEVRKEKRVSVQVNSWVSIGCVSCMQQDSPKAQVWYMLHEVQLGPSVYVWYKGNSQGTLIFAFSAVDGFYSKRWTFNFAPSTVDWWSNVQTWKGIFKLAEDENYDMLMIVIKYNNNSKSKTIP
jgi:hypothetical protein